MTINDKILFWFPTLIWMAVPYFFSSQPSLQVSPVAWQDLFLRKTAHFGEYFILTLLVYRSLNKTTNYSRMYLILLTITVTVLYAASDEYHQSFVVGRYGRFHDIVVDSLGIITALPVLPEW